MASGSTFAGDCQSLFGTTDLYEILNLPKEEKEKLGEKEVKRAYYKASLKWHPDRSKGEEEEKRIEATKRFQVISKAYTILSDKEKRAVYDETGVVDDGGVLDEDGRDWESVWRTLFKPVTAKDIKAFAKKYKGSAEEREDVKAAYIAHEGDLCAIFDNIVCSNAIDDEERFVKMIKEMLVAHEVPPFQAFTQESHAKKQRRKRTAEQEAAEAEEALKAIKAKDGFDENAGLQQMILAKKTNREASMNSFLDQLEAKYGSKKAGGSRKKSKK